MKEKIEKRIKDYEENKYLNDVKIESLNNENMMIDICLKDINKIVDYYENKNNKLEEDLKLTKFSYDNCLKALSDSDESLKEYLESQGRL